jgi:hypothetical protein
MKWPLSAFLLLAMACLSIAGSASGSSPRPRVLLGSGQVAKSRWFAFVTRDQGHGGDQRPCLSISLEPTHRSTPPNPAEIPIGGSDCSSLQPTPELLSVVDELVDPKITVLAMAFVPQVRSVTLYLADRPSKTIPLTLLSRHKAVKTDIDPFRYGTLAFAGDTCVTRFVAHDINGMVLDDGGRMRCRGASGHPRLHLYERGRTARNDYYSSGLRVSTNS